MESMGNHGIILLRVKTKQPSIPKDINLYSMGILA
jgi:hypothetical protein